MNAKVLIAIVAGLVGLVASADVLYWQVNNTAADAEGATKSPYSYAVLRATDGEGGQYYVSENIDSAGNDAGAGVSRDFFTGDNYVGGVMDASKILSTSDSSQQYTGGLSSLSFFLELYDSSGNWVGETNAQSYDSLVNSGAISGFNANFTGVNNAFGSSDASGYRSVPEPTSGLLMLVGLGALALRRRRIA